MRASSDVIPCLQRIETSARTIRPPSATTATLRNANNMFFFMILTCSILTVVDGVLQVLVGEVLDCDSVAHFVCPDYLSGISSAQPLLAQEVVDCRVPDLCFHNIFRLLSLFRLDEFQQGVVRLDNGVAAFCGYGKPVLFVCLGPFLCAFSSCDDFLADVFNCRFHGYFFFYLIQIGESLFAYAG